MERIHVMNLVTSYQLGKISRRQFVQRTSLALGSMSLANALLAACATVPPNAPASTPITPTNTSAAEAAPVAGIVTEDISYLNGTLTATIARPAEGAAPAVIVIQEWWGLNEHIRDITRRFADAGFAALAPDLYHGAIATEPDEARKLVMELDMTTAVQEIDQAISFLLEQEFVSSGKAGIVGYCLGGGLTLQTAIYSDQVAAAVPYYGTLLSPDQAAQVKAAVQAHYGTEDRFDLNDLAAMIEIIKTQAGFDAEAHIYEGAPHSFFNDTRSSYRAAAATAAWERTLMWFRTHIQ